MPKRVTAIGGIFFRSNDPAAIRAWYNTHLGFSADQYGSTFEWRHIDAPEVKGSTIWSAFAKDSKYIPEGKDFMMNLRVENLEWLLGELKKEGIEPLGEMQVYEYGKFAHIMDPEGNKIELWEASDSSAEDTPDENSAQ